MKKLFRSALCILLTTIFLCAFVACNDGENGVAGEPKPTYLTRAKELAETIDKGTVDVCAV